MSRYYLQNPRGYWEGWPLCLTYRSGFLWYQSQQIATLLWKKRTWLEATCELFWIPPHVVEPFLWGKDTDREILIHAFDIFTERYKTIPKNTCNIKVQDHQYIWLRAIGLIIQWRESLNAIKEEIGFWPQAISQKIHLAHRLLKNGWKEFQHDILTAREELEYSSETNK